MSGPDLSVRTARAALGGVVDQSGDDDDVVTAYARAVWSVLAEPGDGVAGALVLAHGATRALEIALAASGGSVEAAEAGMSADDLMAGRRRWGPRRDGVAAPLELARRAGVALLTPEHAHWPVRAQDLGPFGPVCLWLRGSADIVSTTAPAVALVGARASTAYGEQVAAEFAGDAADSGVSVVSGGAYGIDGAAHVGALRAEGPTIALLAGGVEKAYPAGHRDLIDRIARAGAVLSEVPCGTAPTKWRFLARNRLIAALSDATVVVEAAWRSGALNTAHHAQSLGRPLGVVPGPVTSPASSGCHRLLRESDAVCVTTPLEVRQLLGLTDAGLADGTLFDAGPFTGEHTRVLDALSTRSPRTTDDVARRGGFSVADAAAVLGMLELDGAVSRRPGGWVRA